VAGRNYNTLLIPRRWRWLLCLLWGCVLFSPAGYAAPLVVVMDHDNPIHKSFVDELASAYPQRPLQRISREAPLPDDLSPPLITIGVAAAERHRHTPLPTLYLLLPEASVVALRPPQEDQQRRYLVINQPMWRSINLIRHILPKRHRIGTIAVDESSLAPLLRQSPPLSQHRIDIDSKAALFDQLKPHLTAIDLLLLQAGPAITPNSAKALILATYQQRLPLIGYSQALVKAGALAAVHTELAPLARQAAAMIDVWPKSEINWPDHFSLSINYQVARHLGLELPAISVIEQQLHKSEE
jgi:putative tryptophan/tyrosine transport system substrate-binding protein